MAAESFSEDIITIGEAYMLHQQVIKNIYLTLGTIYVRSSKSKPIVMFSLIPQKDYQQLTVVVKGGGC